MWPSWQAQRMLPDSKKHERKDQRQKSQASVGPGKGWHGEKTVIRLLLISCPEILGRTARR